MGKGIKVSIIVPVYNVPEAALRKCLESMLSQTLDDLEILVVDDGSTDQSGHICDEYAGKDKRLKVIHKSNEGLSAARNTGYEAAQGEWVTFVDGDDWIDSATCERTFLLGESNDVDIVIFGTVQEFEHYQNPFKYHYTNGQIFRGAECKQLQCEILNFTGNIATAWAKLIRKSVLDNNHIEHNAGLRQGSEGIEFNVRLFEKIESAIFTDEIFYHYIYNPNSISAKHDEKNHHFVINCFEEIKRQIENSENRSALEKLFYNRFACVVVAAAISGYFSPVNPESYGQRKLSINKYLNNTLVRDTLKNYDAASIGKQRRIVLFLIKRHCWFIVQVLANMRYRQKH